MKINDYDDDDYEDDDDEDEDDDDDDEDDDDDDEDDDDYDLLPQLDQATGALRVRPTLVEEGEEAVHVQED